MKYMKEKKGVTILVIIAIILAITATYLITTDSEIPTTRDSAETGQKGPAQVGVDITPADIEDKLALGDQS